jgi:SLOG cluster2
VTLIDRLVAISISNGPDLNRLGYPQREVDRVLLAICTALIRAGARIVYGGNLDPTGFTFKIFRHLAEAYAVRGRKAPFVHIVPEPVLRRANFDDFTATLKEARGIVETRVAFADETTITLKAHGEATDVSVLAAPLSGNGIKIDSEQAFQAWLGPPLGKPSDAYSAARKAMAQLTVGRVVMGGKMGLKERPEDHYEGAMPGVIEEAILTLDAGQALLTLGAFGGAARDLAIALKLLDSSMRVPRGEQESSYHSAVEQIGKRADRIPESLREELAHIARDDRAEPLGFAIVRALERWQ